MAMTGSKYRGSMKVKDDGVQEPALTNIKDISVAQAGEDQTPPTLKGCGQSSDLKKVPVIKDVGVPASRQYKMSDTGVPNPRGS